MVLMGCLRVSKTENREVSRTREGFPRRAETYEAMTPVPLLAEYTPRARRDRPAAAAVT